MSYYQPLLPPTSRILWGENVVYQDSVLSLRALSLMVDKAVSEAVALPTSITRDAVQNWMKLLAETQPIDPTTMSGMFIPLHIEVLGQVKHFKIQKCRGVSGKRRTFWHRRKQVYNVKNAYPISCGEVKDGQLEVVFKVESIQEQTRF